MDRRKFIVGASTAAVAAAVPGSAALTFDGAERVWTFVRVVVPELSAWNSVFTMAGWVMHRRDLTDLGEPYLSAVRTAREALDV